MDIRLEGSPAIDSESESSEESSSWLDVEPDVETVRVVSLFDERTFSTLPEMLDYCEQQHNFDFLATARRLGLDFIGVIKLVNFIRSCVSSSEGLPEPILLDHIEHDRYLKPVLQNDAVIFLLDEVLQPVDEAATIVTEAKALASGDLIERNRSLEIELRAAQESFANYRLAVEQTLDRRWGSDEIPKAAYGSAKKDSSGDYFESYAAREIHETMLKDCIRTNAYRDFIYGNKHVFRGSVVLDIGCGTGILSMFCAKAGASSVIAVDSSDIIDKARENVFNNNLSDIITCVKGRIEDVTLPVDKVDIIVSEWMGYCLLYEAMLPSVIYARDKYLKPEGLMVPSSATIWMAPFKDESFISEHVSYWRDVYGFDMKAMQEGMFDEVQVQALPKTSVCGESCPFKILDLYRTQPRDLLFTACWSSNLHNGFNGFDGFLIWFDVFFSTSRIDSPPARNITPSKFTALFTGNVAFTTGPDGPETHWKQGVLLAKSKQPVNLAPNLAALAGRINFSAHSNNARALMLCVTWATDQDEQQQSWELK